MPIGIALAKKTVWTAWAKGLELDALISPSEWAERHRVIPEGVSSRPGRWRNANAPFLKEIADRLAAHDPARNITFAKSAQVGGTALIENVLGWIIDVSPGPTLVVHPTREAALDWNAEKLDPTIEATPRLRRAVSEVRSRANDGSTMRRKRFPGGSIVLTGANSAAGLRQKSIKIVVRDDFDEWPHDVGGQGDPAVMAEARQKSYERSGLAKTLDVSTPTLEVSSRIWKAWKEGSQGEYEVPCPHCGEFQTLEWGTKERPYEPFYIKFNPSPPYHAHMICACCGEKIFQWQLDGMLSRGHWTHREPARVTKRSYRINALYSLFEGWDTIVHAYLEAKGDPGKMPGFVNLSLGLPYQGGADGVKAEALLTHREDYKLGTVPVGALLVTLGADVQSDGIYFETIGWGRDRQSWGIDFGFLEGETGTTDGLAWKKLAEALKRTYRDAFGNDRPIEAAAVDAGYLSEVVIEFCRKHAITVPVRGVAGMNAPIWAGRAIAREFSERGRRRRRGPKAFEVGTWAAKERNLGALRVERVEGVPAFPASYCHFSQDHTLEIFEQLTAEVFVRQKDRKTGVIKVGWHTGGRPNHYLDCRIYAMAMAEKLGLSKNAPAQWEWLERKWSGKLAEQAGLFDTPAPPRPDPQPVAVSMLPPKPAGTAERPRRQIAL